MWVYIVRAATGDVLYVGRTADLVRRFTDHSRRRWFADAHDIELIHCPDLPTAAAKEVELIDLLDPRHNVTHTKKPAPQRRDGSPVAIIQDLIPGKVTVSRHDEVVEAAERSGRRRRGVGSIVERTPGCWQVRATVNGKRVTRRVHGDRAAAEGALAALTFAHAESGEIITSEMIEAALDGRIERLLADLGQALRPGIVADVIATLSAP